MAVVQYSPRTTQQINSNLTALKMEYISARNIYTRYIVQGDLKEGSHKGFAQGKLEGADIYL